jgi:aminopeptidase N
MGACIRFIVIFLISGFGNWAGQAQPALFKEQTSCARRGGQVLSYSYDGPQPFDMLNYKLDVSLAMVNDGFEGKMTMTMRLKESVDSLALNAVGLTFDTLRVDDVQKSFAFRPATESFTIFLGGTRLVGETLRIEIVYRRTPGFPRPSSRQGYYFFHRDSVGLPSHVGYTFSEPYDARFWMPCYDQPWDKATSETHITVPNGYVAASNGKLLGTTNNGNGTTTWHWRENHQIATYLMCLTVSQFTLSSLPYIKLSGDTIPIQYYSWRTFTSGGTTYTDSANFAPFLPRVREMIQTLRASFGEYPFDKYGMTTIVPFGYLGMEHQSLSTINRYFATSEWVVSHELGHQWWGDNVTCGTWADIWLNEGFATYTEALWKEHIGGFPELKRYMLDTLQRFQFGSWQGAIYDPVSQGFNLFDQVVYSKAGWVLHTLRGVLGDSTFFQTLKAFQTRWAGKSAVTSEFKAVVDSIAQREMSWFFNQWIYGRGWPMYASRFTWSADTLNLTIQQRQQASWPTYTMPMRVRAYFGTQQRDYIVQDSLREQTFRLPLNTQPDSVVLDPDGWILKQIVAPTSVVEEKLPTEFRLYQNYPNPFNPTTSITFLIPVGTRHAVSLRVFDVLGREIVNLVNETKPSGEYTIQFDASNLASGIYYYRLHAGLFVETKKMILIR